VIKSSEKSFSEDFIVYAYGKGWLTDWEFNF
jgi:hypothetical protein